MVILMLSGMSYYGMMNGKLYLDFDKVNLFVIYFWKNRGEKMKCLLKIIIGFLLSEW